MICDLEKLLARCKCGVYIEVNAHRDSYETPADKLQEYSENECPPQISDEVREAILESGNIVDLHFYPDTPIGFYHVVHHDLGEALRIALDCIAERLSK